MLGFDALGHLALGQVPASGNIVSQTITTVVSSSVSMARQVRRVAIVLISSVSSTNMRLSVSKVVRATTTTATSISKVAGKIVSAALSGAVNILTFFLARPVVARVVILMKSFSGAATQSGYSGTALLKDASAKITKDASN